MGKSERGSFSLAKGVAVFAALVYFFLALYRIDFQSIWYDEGLTLHYSSLPLLDGLAELGRRSVHPPAYFAVMHFWLRVAGDSDFALRFVSAVFGSLFVSASFLLGAKLANRRLGAILALVTGTSPFVVYYGQEARMYTAVAFLSSLSAVGAVGIVRRGRGYLGYTIASSLAMLTHYFAFLMLGSQLAIVIPLLFLQRRYQDLAKWLASLAVAVIVFVPWAMNLRRVATTHEDFWRAKLPFISMVQDTILHFSLGEIAWPDNYLMFIFYVAAALGLLGVFRRSLRTAVLVATATLVASLLALVVFPKATYVPRYVLVVAPAFYLLVAAGIYNLGGFLTLEPVEKRSAGTGPQTQGLSSGQPLSYGRLAKSVVLAKTGSYASFCLAVALALFLAGSNAVSLLAHYYDPASFRREDFKALAEFIEPKLRPGDGLVFVAGPLNYALFHYLPETAPSVWVDSDARLKSDDALPELDGFLKREDVKRVCLVRSLVSVDDLVDPDRITQRRVMERYGAMTILKDVRGLVAEAYDRDLYDHFKDGSQVDITFGGEVRLPRYRLQTGRLGRGGQLEVELFWEPLRRISRLLWVSLQLVDRASGKMVALADFPAGGLVPTTTWGPGMRVADKALLGAPSDAPLGEYDAYLIVYDPATGERLGVVGGPPGSRADAATLFMATISD